jgi:chorismate synthase
LSGVRHGKALGSPICLMIKNDDFVHWTEIMSSEAIDVQPKNPRIVTRPRPGHADLPGGQKYQTRDLRDILERASARETAARVACGAVAKQLLAAFGIEVRSHVVKLGSVPAEPLERTWEEIAAIPTDSPLNCADPAIQAEMIALIDQAKTDGDTLGGVFEVVAKGLPVGLGSHTSWEDKLDGRIARAIMSIHAVKAVEIGEGVANAGRPGSQVHDEIYFRGSPPYEGGVAAASADGVVLSPADKSTSSNKSDVAQTAAPLPPAHAGGSDFFRPTNRAGGLEGGITNGEELRVRGYKKPIATLRKPLHSVDIDTKEENLAAFERSDITAVPAAGVIGEAMLAIVLANTMREKFGGDSIEEMKRNYDGYSAQVGQY